MYLEALNQHVACYNNEMQAMGRAHQETTCQMLFFSQQRLAEVTERSNFLLAEQSWRHENEIEAMKGEEANLKARFKGFEEGASVAHVATKAANQIRFEEQCTEFRAAIDRNNAEHKLAMDRKEAEHKVAIAATVDRREYYKSVFKQKWEQAKESSQQLADIESVLQDN